MTYLEKLNEEIATTKTEKSRLLQLCVELEGIENRLPAKKRALKKAGEILEKELKDVENLKRISFVALWQTLVGNRKAKLTKEEEEYLAAKLEYEELEQELGIMKSRKEELSTVVAAHQQTKNDIKRLLKNKEHVLVSMEPSIAPALKKLGEAVDEKTLIVTELKAAIDLGEETNSEMRRMMGLIGKVPTRYTDRYDYGMEEYTRELNYHYAAAIQSVRLALPKLQYRLDQYAQLIRKIERDIETTKRVNVGHFEMYSTYVVRDIGPAALKKTTGVQTVVTKTQRLLWEYHSRESSTLRELERERLDLMNKF